jgi:hypothetical protein
MRNSVTVCLLTCLFCLLANGISAEDGLIKDKAIESVKIGDPGDKIFTTFKSRYQIIDNTKPGATRTIILFSDKQKAATFFVDQHNQIFMIEIYKGYQTQDKIGPGSTISQAIHIYGTGSITPTDVGYLMTFKKLNGIGFLLTNNDIPKEFRNIPDDVFTPEQEEKILSFGNVHISAIQIE